MSEIRNRVEARLDTIILRAIETYDWDEAIAEAKAQILLIPEIAIVDRKATLYGEYGEDFIVSAKVKPKTPDWAEPFFKTLNGKGWLVFIPEELRNVKNQAK